MLAALRAPGLRQPATVEAAYAAVVVGQVGLITALNEQITQLQEVVAEHFGRHPAADIYLSQPGFGGFLAALAFDGTAMTRSGSATLVHGRTIPGEARSLVPRARRPSC